MAEAATLVGRMVARRYVIEAHIGSGAMGDVYRARHVDLPIEIALKIMRPTIAQDELFQKRFYREAKAASRLEHPNSVRVIDFGREDDGLVYLAMEFLRGRDLLTLLREEWPLEDKRIVDILAQTLSALSIAHGLGIVHRDLKPENIMIVPDEDDGGRDHVKVCDFGIAKLNDPRAFDSKDGQGKALTTSGALIGTPEYMSPEQARGDPLDARSDLYAIGVILYQLLTGQVPFTAENTLGIVIKQVTEEPLPPSRLRASVNPLLEQVCLRAMRKKVDERYQSAKEMRNELRAALGIRPPIPSASDSQPTSLPRISDSADTLIDPRQSRRSGMEAASDRPVDFERKDTSDGTEIVLPVSSNGKLVGVVVAVLAIVAVLAFVFVLRPKQSGAEEKGAGLVPSAELSAPTETAVSPAPMLPSSTSEKRAVLPQPNNRPLAGPIAARPGVSVAPGPTPIEARSSAPPAPSPTVTAQPASTPPAPAASYNPMGAFVALDSLTTERVEQGAVRKKMGELVPKLTECYRNALLVVGAPVGGSAGIHLSIDSSGRMQAVVTANQLPPFQRCAAQAVQGHSVPASALDGAGGATAEQWLKLNP